jgi:hypothetical protein
MKDTNEIDVYEVDGKSSPVPLVTILVKNHDKYDAQVILSIDNHLYAIDAYDLLRAVENASAPMRKQT